LTQKTRLDALLVSRGDFADTDSAAKAILAGMVTSPKRGSLKPGMLVSPSDEFKVKERRQFVSRGGIKLAHALQTFAISVEGLRCIDIGAGSGGFTDCLLQNGAKAVTAVDVGYGQFDWKLRQDVRVELFERTNFLSLVPSKLSKVFDLAVVDLSFTKTSNLLRQISSFLKPDGQMLVLVKPQFELKSELASPPGFVRGVVHDKSLHRVVLEGFIDQAASVGLVTKGLVLSPIKGADGNTEFLFWATLKGLPANIDIPSLVEQISHTV